MSLLLAVCMIGSAVIAKLPADNQPTLRQAIVAAGETPGAHLSNLDQKLTNWAYECDGDNYAAAYLVANGEQSGLEKLWIARYDEGKAAWSEASSTPPHLQGDQPQKLVALFYDGYYLYIQFEDAKGRGTTLQFNTGLTYRSEFFGTTSVGLTNGALLYAPDPNVLPGDPLAAIFDPESSTSRAVFPPVTSTPTIEAGEKLETQELQRCGQGWFRAHGVPADDHHPFRRLG